MALIDSDDTAAVLNELRRRKAEDDPEHFHEYELDAGGHLKRLFWADADALLNMVLIDSHDVVVVDTTFRTNKYGVPFVPFVGLNHHRRPVVLGCGVVADQSPDSFVWLMRAFTRAAGEQPKSVITDGSDAVVHAVETVLPLSDHRMCSWQVEQGIGEHLGGRSAQEGFRSLMSDDACSPVEFEERWRAFLARHRTATNQEWLCRMYVRRELWAAAFVRDKFFLGMARDQRTECLATGLHTGLRESMSLLALIRHADSWTRRMLADQYKLDGLADKSREELTTGHYLEEDAARSFTPANFAILREEFKAMDDFEIVDTLSSSSNGSGDKVYTVSYCGKLFTVLRCHDLAVGGGSDDRENEAGVVFKCSCRKMEREGLPCRHILCVLRHERASSIPKCCKLRRLLRHGDTRNERLGEMEELGRQVFDLASQDAEEFEEIKRFLQDWLQERRGNMHVV